MTLTLLFRWFAKELFEKGLASVRTGGYFALHFDEGSEFVLRIGTCEKEAGRKYMTNATEKATRLAEHRTEHKSSWQSRDTEMSRYGGAILVGENLILSFSGLPETADEVLMIALAIRMGWMDIDEGKKIAELTQNELFERFIQDLIQLDLRSVSLDQDP